ncbi:hypothetical protein LIER_36814 [Lithospermum erythrorhizon]|uniref:DUF7769 domain-containing protein n=1 Tax=Lithospermum erythrorhizon TaxID=34254 RepID=A0AAV3PB56_LITER
MNFQDFDLNVPFVSDHRTCYIDLNKIPDNINPNNVLFDQNEFVVDTSESYPGNSPNFLIDVEQLLEEEEEEEEEEEDEEVHVYENHPEQFLEEEQEGGGQLDENDIEQFIEEEEERGGGGGGHSNQFERAGYNHGMQTNNKRKRLTDEQQDIVYCSLLQISVHGKLKSFATTKVANTFNLKIRQVQRIWKKKIAISVGEVRKKVKCGRKRVHVDIDRIPEIPLNERMTLDSLSNALHVSYSVLFRRFKEGLFRRHSNAIKPHLREENKRSRLQFCISMLDPSTLTSKPKFVDMYNVVHIDEKWFYMTQKNNNYYLHPFEEEPLRTVQSKNFIGKVMFLAAIARPRFDNDGNEVFSGKIGIFPFVKKEAAQRRSCNRAAAFREASFASGYDIRLVCQPPNSPDLNILDLGFFSAIQSLQRKACARTFEQLVLAVQKAFEDYPPKKVNHVFVTLQLCIQEIMKFNGSNR